jgi:hypothetical protein
MEGALISGPAGPTDVDYSLSYSDAGEIARAQREEGESPVTERTESGTGRIAARPVRRTTHVEPKKG